VDVAVGAGLVEGTKREKADDDGDGMKELLEVVDAHGAAAFWVGAFALIGLMIVCDWTLKVIQLLRKRP
jgi:hypothetical protein